METNLTKRMKRKRDLETLKETRVKLRGKPMRMTDDQIQSMTSEAGGFTRLALAKMGVPWPPPQGWRKALIQGKPIPSIRSRPKNRIKPDYQLPV